MSFGFVLQTKVVAGKGARGEVQAELERFGAKKVLVVTDEILNRKTDVVQKVVERIKIPFVIFDKVKPDSDCDIVNEGYEVARRESVDALVSIGGGSSIDTAKAISILLAKGGKIQDHVGVYIMERKAVPHIAIPTTAGTGSEVSHVAVIKDSGQGRKLLFVDYNLMPDVAILDPELTVGMPRSVTIHTALDALTHCIESIHSTEHNPFSDAFAMRGIQLIKENLPRVVEKPDDIDARFNLQIAATMGGAAFTNAQVGVVHAFAHALGAVYSIPHGLANALMLPYGMQFNAPEIPERYQLVAKAWGIDGPDSHLRVIEEIKKFLRMLGIPSKLADVGVRREDFDRIAKLALEDGSIISNPRFAMDEQLLKRILEYAWEGKDIDF